MMEKCSKKRGIPAHEEQYKKALQYAIDITRKNLDVFTDHYPHVSTKNVYNGEKNELWTSSFYPGMCYLAYENTGDKEFLKHVDDYLDSFDERLRLRKHISHDLGFLYTLSCVANVKLIGDERAKEIAMRAADMLTERYNEKGKYIQAWGEMGIGYPDVKIIIDTMLNLPLLYWSSEEGGKNWKIAENHAMTAAGTLIRPDYSSYHTYLMNPETGEAVCGKTHQGFRDESTWARGQGWAVYGYALSYRYTKNPRFLQIAKEAAEVFIRNLPEDKVAYWDFTFTDENPDIRDTSAAAIFVCGLLELCEYVSEEETERYIKIADEVILSLDEHYTTREIPESNGVLTEGVYHRDAGARECVIWGDYFYMEALTRMTKDWNPYW